MVIGSLPRWPIDVFCLFDSLLLARHNQGSRGGVMTRDYHDGSYLTPIQPSVMAEGRYS